jgi:Phage integrase family
MTGSWSIASPPPETATRARSKCEVAPYPSTIPPPEPVTATRSPAPVGAGRSAVVRVRGRGVELTPLKTAASYRTIPLPKVIGDELAAHLARWPVVSGLVFTNQQSEPIQQHPFAAMWKTARRRAGLPAWVTPHDLRHYYASLLIRSGASVKVVQSAWDTPAPRRRSMCTGTCSRTRRTEHGPPSMPCSGISRTLRGLAPTPSAETAGQHTTPG